ncbi:DNA-binding domain-containing protein [uncultured Erythrobacter sp.]|uniref:HvfC/BufC N-terminal domain-containing protein n=1 Tax=uncultured Erythrobacter sp. TaxID=263913 RepID=UPI0026238CDA|nr:DNA-binding domain-containing protein [uncultured Erythrobacter sp.]
MSSLAERQDAFLHSILDEAAPLPDGWGNSQAAGMTVYRGNYRSALMGALAETYERTALCVGSKAFAQASINHAIAHPPSGWTIDEAGEGFNETCAKLFPERSEVAELAWLEWTMLELATAPDSTPINAQDFAAVSVDFVDEDWGELRLEFQPRATARLVGHDLETLWRALGGDEPLPDTRFDAPHTCIASRAGERPTFTILEADHAVAFAAIQDGASYGELIAVLIGENEAPTPEDIQTAAMRAGAMLGTWLNEGLIVAINP